VTARRPGTGRCSRMGEAGVGDVARRRAPGSSSGEDAGVRQRARAHALAHRCLSLALPPIRAPDEHRVCIRELCGPSDPDRLCECVRPASTSDDAMPERCPALGMARGWGSTAGLVPSRSGIRETASAGWLEDSLPRPTKACDALVAGRRCPNTIYLGRVIVAPPPRIPRCGGQSNT